MISGRTILLATLLVFVAWFMLRWALIERARGGRMSVAPGSLAIGFGADFFDTLGIGSFAPTTALFRFFRVVPDEHIPGTLNVGYTLPTVIQAFAFIGVVEVDMPTLVGMIAASAVGARLGASVVARLPRIQIQLGMGVALLIAALLFCASNLDLIPGGGDATGLQGATLAFAIGVNFVLGALMMLGIGMYAPCLILVCLLGMSPITAFPIMMGSCAFLMPAGGIRFVQSARYDLRAAISVSLGGIPGVLIAAFIVKSMPLEWLRWLVVIVVSYAGLMMLQAARKPAEARG